MVRLCAVITENKSSVGKFIGVDLGVVCIYYCVLNTLL